MKTVLLFSSLTMRVLIEEDLHHSTASLVAEVVLEVGVFGPPHRRSGFS